MSDNHDIDIDQAARIFRSVFGTATSEARQNVVDAVDRYANELERECAEATDAVEAESFEFLNELALTFRSGEKHARPQYTQVLEGIRAVLAHLTTAGRLIPAGGMPLTAEQVENVRAAREELRGYRNYTGHGRSHVNQLIAAVDALFPATEPAVEVTQAEGFCSFCGWSRDACARGEGECAPAEPAEEETKAEGSCTGSGSHYLYPCVLPDGHAGVHADSRGLRWNNPASSPVVPAPTETEWQTWQEVPEGVWYQSGRDRVARAVWMNIAGIRYIQVPSDGVAKPCVITSDYMVNYAPFVAAEEG